MAESTEVKGGGETVGRGVDKQWVGEWEANFWQV